MTIKINQLKFTLAFIILHFVAKAQVVFPTTEDHDRKVDSFINVLKNAKEDTNKVKTLLAVGEELVYWNEEEQPKSLSYLIQAHTLSKKLQSKNYQIESLLLLTALSSRSNDHNNALKFIKEAILIAETTNDYTKISKCYNWLGGVYRDQGKYSDAIIEFDKALEFAFRSGNNKAIMSSYSTLGMFYMDKNPPGYPEAIRYYIMAFKIAEETGEIETIYEALNNIGLMYSILEDYGQSLFYYRKMKEKTGTSTFLSNLLIIYRGSKDYIGGINEINEYVDRNEKAGDKRRIALGMYHLGSFNQYIAEELDRTKGNIDSINYYLDKALVSFKRCDNIEKESNIKDLPSRALSYGMTYKLKAKLMLANPNRPEILKKYLEIAMAKFVEELRAHQKPNFLNALCYVNIGEVLSMQAKINPPSEERKKYNEALNYLDSAIGVRENETNTNMRKLTQDVISDAYRVKAEIYKTLGNFDKSFESLKYYAEVKDSIKANETRQKIEQMRIANAIIVGTTEEKARYENTIKEMRMDLSKKQDSMAFQHALADERFNQKQKEFQLKQAELTIANNQKELNLFKFLKTEAELESELIKREEKEKALTIANQEKSLQQNQLQLQKTQIDLKESQIQAQNRQRQIYIGSIGILSLIFGSVFFGIRSRQKSDRLVASERLKLEKANASHQMAELELQSLRAQLNPHFMFNSLNAIQELILKEDTDNSHLYLSRFSELLRMLLDNANHAFIPLKKELSLLELYLSLENLRIPDLKYSINIDPSIDSNAINIPNMILQPYIENAIWHGLSHKKGERKLSIGVHRMGDSMVCEIEDNGVGRKKAAELKSLYRREHRSKGMELLSKRFNLLSKEYGAGIQTTIEDLYDNDGPGGTKVNISIPFSLMEHFKAVNSLT